MRTFQSQSDHEKQLKKKLEEGILQQIESVQKESDELMKKKQQAEAEANLKIDESLNNNKK